MIDKIKKDIVSKYRITYKFKINNIRNKSEYVIGMISEIYDRVFVVKSSDGKCTSFTYSDILTGNVEIHEKIAWQIKNYKIKFII